MLCAEEVCRQLAAGTCALRLAQIANIGQRGETPTAAQPQPGAARLQVATGMYLRSIGPLRQWQAWAGVEFIAICRKNQRLRMTGAPGKNDQAHGDLFCE